MKWGWECVQRCFYLTNSMHRTSKSPCWMICVDQPVELRQKVYSFEIYLLFYNGHNHIISAFFHMRNTASPNEVWFVYRLQCKHTEIWWKCNGKCIHPSFVKYLFEEEEENLSFQIVEPVFMASTSSIEQWALFIIGCHLPFAAASCM